MAIRLAARGSFQSSEVIFATYQNAGVRAYDIKDPFRPKEVAGFVPPSPPTTWVDPRPNRPRVLHSADVFVDNGICYATDFNAGLYIAEYKG